MKNTRILAALVLAIGAGSVALAESDDEYYTFSLDLRTGTRQTTGEEIIQWNSAWYSEDDGNTVKVSVDNGDVLLSGESGEGAAEWIETTPGTYKFTHATYVNGRAKELLTAKFEVVETELAEMKVYADGYEGVFDGEGHSIEVTALGADGGTVLADATISYALAEDGPYTSENPVFTNVVSTSVWYRVRLAGYATVEGSVPVVITEATFDADSIVVEDYSGDYDGDAHTISVTAPSTATVTYSLTEDGEYTTELPTFTGAVSMTVYYRVEQNGYTTVTGSATVTIGSDEDGTDLALDLRTGERETTSLETIQWSGDWYDEDAGYSATVTADNNETLLDGETGEGSVSWLETTPGTYTLTHTTYVDGTAVETLTATFVVPGETELAAFTVSVSDFVGTYDGAGHSASVTPDAEGEAVISYATSEDGPFTRENPAFTDVGEWTVYYRVRIEGYETVEGTATVEITKASADASWVTVTGYDGDFDGRLHSILVEVDAPEDATITYSLTEDGEYTTEIPTFSGAVTTTVYYRVEFASYETVSGSQTVAIGADEGVDFTVDLRDDPRETAGEEILEWDALWDGDETASVSVSVNGEWLFTSDAGEEGTYTWTPTAAGSYTFTIETLSEIEVLESRQATFVYSADPLDFTDVSAEGYAAPYDGEAHAIAVTAPYYATITYSLEEDGEYTEENPSFTDLCSTTVYYRVDATGYNTYSGSATVEITAGDLITASGFAAAARYPWQGAVDIDCTVVFETIEDVTLTVLATDADTGEALSVQTLTVGGETVENGAYSPASGTTLRLTWDASADLDVDTVENLTISLVASNASAASVTNTAEGLVLDLRTGERTRLCDEEPLAYDALWFGDDSATMTITENGETLAEGLTGSGTYGWDTVVEGTYTLQLLTYDSEGTLVDTQTVTYYETGTTSQGVPFTWFEEEGLLDSDWDWTRTDYEEVAVEDLDGDGYTAWEEYVVGTDPQDDESQGLSIASITIDENGQPVITWSPDLNELGTKDVRLYTVWESDSPAGPWVESGSEDSSDGRVVDNGTADKKFYKVTVDLP